MPRLPVRRPIERTAAACSLPASAPAAIGLVAALALVGCCTFSGPRYEGPVSDHFDGRRFHNRTDAGREQRGFRDFLRWRLTGERRPWPASFGTEPGPAPPRAVPPGTLRVTLVGHASVLIQLDGLTILTDPIWSERAGPLPWTGPRRRRPPGVRFEDLPPIDVVLVSHNHYDHLDLPTLRRLAAAHRPRAFTGLGNGPLLRDAGLARTTELDWWDVVDLGGGRTLVSVPAEHFSNRGLCDRNATLWTGFVLTTPEGALYFAGDTGWGPHFAEVRERFGPVRLALLPIGAFLPRWFMGPVHLSPEEAVAAHEALAAATSVAIHHETFQLADEGPDEAATRLRRTIARRPTPGRFWILPPGWGREVPAVEVPAVEVPAVEGPAVEGPAVEGPAVEVPAIDARDGRSAGEA